MNQPPDAATQDTEQFQDMQELLDGFFQNLQQSQNAATQSSQQSQEPDTQMSEKFLNDATQSAQQSQGFDTQDMQGLLDSFFQAPQQSLGNSDQDLQQSLGAATHNMHQSLGNSGQDLQQSLGAATHNMHQSLGNSGQNIPSVQGSDIQMPYQTLDDDIQILQQIPDAATQNAHQSLGATSQDTHQYQGISDQDLQQSLADADWGIQRHEQDKKRISDAMLQSSDDALKAQSVQLENTYRLGSASAKSVLDSSLTRRHHSAQTECWAKHHVLFIDIRKAFDTVPVGALMEAADHGIPSSYSCLSQGHCTHPHLLEQGQARCHRTHSQYRGCQQGCPLSGLLFNLFINDIFDGVAPIKPWTIA
ncbi:hypothetical protein BASA81_016751 [Batrachochytrium salamandrivorans]|nr:hypothetical protein BASA81_016751 [Batrachochytrium salamandrivorans]